jgi:phosphatidylcholine synthase
MHNTLETDRQAAHPPVRLYSQREKLLAWGAHLFTATGAIWGLLTILAIMDQQWRAAFGWMGIAVLVDSFDGILARRLRVKTILPNFDGALLDNTVDYLNYVFVPALFLTQSDLLPHSVKIVGASMILLASAYQFCQDEAKTADNYFKGFPSYWNILVFYLFVLQLSGWVNFTVVVVLTILVFVPIKYIYPSRTSLHQSLTLILSALWSIAVIIIFFTYPNHPVWLVWASLLFAVYYVAMSLYQMFVTRA